MQGKVIIIRKHSVNRRTTIRTNITIKRHSTGQGARITFTRDLNNNKHKSVSKRTPNKKRQYNINQYKDGIHPGDLLAKAWLRKIEEQAKRDCWTIKQKPREDK